MKNPQIFPNTLVNTKGQKSLKKNTHTHISHIETQTLNCTSIIPGADHMLIPAIDCMAQGKITMP